MTTIYDYLVAHSIDCSNHWQSDLYVIASTQVLALIAEYRAANPAEITSQLFLSDQGPMVELSFQYMPFWRKE